MHNFYIYCGKDSRRPSPLRSYVVQRKPAAVGSPKQHISYFDNFLLAINC